MDQQRFDIWLRAFESNSAESGPAALSRLFGIPPEVAAGLLRALPRVVRREAPVLQAQRIVAALESIGGHAEMVACALRPVPVVIVGKATEDAPVHEESALPANGTLRLGTQELAAFGMSAWGAAMADTLVEPPRAREVTVREVEAPAVVSVPAAAPAMPWQSLAIAPALAAPVARTTPLTSAPPAARTVPLSAPPPALAHAAPAFAQRNELELAPLDLSPIEHNALRAPLLPNDALPATASSFVVTRDLRAWMDAGSPAAAAPAIAAVNAAVEIERVSLAPLAGTTNLSLALEAPRQPRLLTALPAEDALAPVAETLRRPSARAMEPRRAPTSSVAPPALKLDAKRVLESVRAPLQIAKRAQTGDWRSALSGHPQAGFAFVLSATTLGFWLIELSVR
jgi:hypothetical protein